MTERESQRNRDMSRSIESSALDGAGGALPHCEFYPFDHAHPVPARELAHVLGGKGASLAEMTRALGFAVPPGFTIPLSVSAHFQREGRLPDEFVQLLDYHIRLLGEKIGRRLGDRRDPLLLAVRSGAAISMPGMLDTVLNLGINDETVEGLAETAGDYAFAWDCYRRFLRMYATTVLGVEEQRLGSPAAKASREAYCAEASRIRQVVVTETGSDIPQDPLEQLHRTVTAVFNSWNSARAKVYRAREGINDDLGTAVNIQAMVFGNRGDASGTGVVFTRNPSTGEPKLFGDYLPHAQGEDVVSGVARTLPIAHMAEHAPLLFDQLQSVLRLLEVHYRDLCDVEFTVEGGRLWLLQTRAGKRSATAAVRIAADLVRDPDILLTEQEAAERAPAEIRARARQEVLAASRRDGAGQSLLTQGLGASPGRACGRIVLDCEAALEASSAVILVRPHTSPEDVAGMSAAAGILTSTGGLVSHAAVVAREWGTPAVVGATDVLIEEDGIRVGEVVLQIGDTITIDGATGEIWRGELETYKSDRSDDDVLREALPELGQIESWSASPGASP
jgi:pyruvate, orthophosphate dikinase